MASEVAEAFVSLIPTARGFGRRVESQIGGDTDRAGRRTGSRFGRVFASSSISPLRAIGAAAVGLFAIDKVKDFFASSIGEAREAQKVGAITAQVIKSTGGAAKVTAGQVGQLATAISKKTGIDDEAIQSASNLLLTFTNVRNEVGKGNDVFNQATQAATDLGAAMGKDPKSAAIQLGKALNDPVKGVAALSRVGVSFTAQQKNQIKTLVSSGNTLGAQKVILGELRKEFGGTAAAAATQGEKMSVAFGNLKEQVGTALLPVLDKVEGFISSKVIPAVSGFITGIQDGTGAGGKFRAFLEGIYNAVKPVVATLVGQVVPAVKGFFASLSKGDGGSAAGMFQKIAAGVQPVIVGLKTFGSFILGTIVPAIGVVVGYLRANLIPILQQIVGVIVGSILPILGRLAGFFIGTVVPAVYSIVIAVGSRLKPVFDALFAAISGKILPVIRQAAAKFMTWLPTIEAVAKIVIKVVGFVLKLAAAILGKVLPVVIKFAAVLIVILIKAVVAVIGIVIKIIGWVIKFGAAIGRAAVAVAHFVAGVKERFTAAVAYVRGLPARLVSAIGELGSKLLGKGRDLIKGLQSGISEKFGDVKKFLSSLPGRIVSALGDVGSLLRDAGERIIQGLLDGITSKFSAVKNKLSELTDSLPDWKGPAERDGRILRPAGKLVIGGFIDGLESQYGAVRRSLSGFTGTMTAGQQALDARLTSASKVAAVRAPQYVGFTDSASQGVARQQIFNGPVHTASTQEFIDAYDRRGRLRESLHPTFAN